VATVAPSIDVMMAPCPRRPSGGYPPFSSRANRARTIAQTDYDPQKCAFNVLKSNERLVIYIKSDSLTTTVDIKSFIKSSIAYYNYSWKAVERVNTDIDCASTGTREKEILDFIGGNKL